MILDIYNNKLFHIQRKYENGLITEAELSEEEIIKLKELYKMQICELKNSIVNHKYNILKYRAEFNNSFENKKSV